MITHHQYRQNENLEKTFATRFAVKGLIFIRELSKEFDVVYSEFGSSRNWKLRKVEMGYDGSVLHTIKALNYVLVHLTFAFSDWGEYLIIW